MPELRITKEEILKLPHGVKSDVGLLILSVGSGLRDAYARGKRVTRWIDPATGDILFRWSE